MKPNGIASFPFSRKTFVKNSIFFVPHKSKSSSHFHDCCYFSFSYSYNLSIAYAIWCYCDTFIRVLNNKRKKIKMTTKFHPHQQQQQQPKILYNFNFRHILIIFRMPNDCKRPAANFTWETLWYMSLATTWNNISAAQRTKNDDAAYCSCFENSFFFSFSE